MSYLIRLPRRGSSGLVGPCFVVGTEEMLAAQDPLDLGQVWDPGKMNSYTQRNVEYPLKYPMGRCSPVKSG